MIIIWDIGAASARDISKAVFQTVVSADIGCAVFREATAETSALTAVIGRGHLTVQSAEKIAVESIGMNVLKTVKTDAQTGVQIGVRLELKMAIKMDVKRAVTGATKMMM